KGEEPWLSSSNTVRQTAVRGRSDPAKSVAAPKRRFQPGSFVPARIAAPGTAARGIVAPQAAEMPPPEPSLPQP
ncbi:MAG: hypothetical protein ACXVZQ_10055, partial [Terriglobales bacterium]